MNGLATYRSPCLGLCDRGPAALVERSGVIYRAAQLGPVTPEQATEIVRTGMWSDQDHSPTAVTSGQLLRRVGVVDPSSIDSYREHGGVVALQRARAMGPEAVIRAVSKSGLLGRGGAAFSTGRKWESVAKEATRPHYLVCNADESEPGTFKDRVLMENDPFALVEGMAIAAFATGCEKAFLYVRA